MALIDQVQGLLDVDVDVEPWTAQDEYGRGTYGAKRTVKARVAQGQFKASGGNGQAIVAAYKVILGEAVVVDVRDRLTLPAAFGSRAVGGNPAAVQPPIREVRPVFFCGTHDHSVIYCG